MFEMFPDENKFEIVELFDLLLLIFKIKSGSSWRLHIEECRERLLLKDVEIAATAAAAEAVKNKGRVHVRCTKYFLIKTNLKLLNLLI